jgi:hypothetical protein
LISLHFIILIYFFTFKHLVIATLKRIYYRTKNPILRSTDPKYPGFL